jgi:RNA polymerase sigma-70 factor (ECF subfamily)
MIQRQASDELPRLQDGSSVQQGDAEDLGPGASEVRLSRIQTRWTLFRQAHGDDAEACRAREALLRDYYGAVYKYLIGIIHDPTAAQDLSQSFALRFIEGRFRHADPARGRFRDYLKKALKHMVYDSHRDQRCGFGLIAPEALPDPSESDFEKAWRADMLERTWATLERAWEALGEGRPAYSALLELLRVDPTLRAPQIVERLSAQRGIHVKEDWVRQAKKRAWASFADHLIDEVASTFESGDLDVLEEELIELDLLKYCQSALGKRRRR